MLLQNSFNPACIFRLTQSQQKELSLSGIAGTKLRDLPKINDRLSHYRLIAKLEAFGLDRNSLLYRFIQFFVRREKKGSFFSDFVKKIRGIPEGSVLDPLLFSIFINGIFLMLAKSDICNVPDDYAIYSAVATFF